MDLRTQLGRMAILTALALPIAAQSAAAQPTDPETGGGQWNNGWNNGQQQPPPNNGWNNGGNNGNWNNGQQQQPPPNNGWNNGGPPPNNNGWNNGGPPPSNNNERPPAPVHQGPDAHRRTATDLAVPGQTDHDLAVGHIAVGFWGFDSLPFFPLRPAGATAGGTVGGAGSRSLNAPTIGMRYWFSNKIGFDATLAFGVTSYSNADDTELSQFGFGIHLGLPIALYTGKHYTFLIIPELGFAYASGTEPNEANPNDNPRTQFNAIRFNLGARIGTEINFGFIDIPELALEATVGLHLDYASGAADVCNDPDCNSNPRVEQSGLSILTDVQRDPWDIFVGGIRAKYYFF